jgi:hypothetical protein
MLVSIFSKLKFKRFFAIVCFKYICKSMELLLIHLLKMEKKSSIISKTLLDWSCIVSLLHALWWRGKIGPNKYLTGGKWYIMNIMYTICLSRKKTHPWSTTSNDWMMLSSSVNSSSGYSFPFLIDELIEVPYSYIYT